MSEVSAKEKGTAMVFAVVATVILIEAGFRLIAPSQHAFNNVSDAYPDNPRGYFDLVSAEGEPEVYGIPMNTSDSLGTASSRSRQAQHLDWATSGAGPGVSLRRYAAHQLGEYLGTSVRNGGQGLRSGRVVGRYATKHVTQDNDWPSTRSCLMTSVSTAPRIMSLRPSRAGGEIEATVNSCAHRRAVGPI